MTHNDSKTRPGEPAPIDGEIIPPDAGGRRAREPGNVFFDLRGGSASAQIFRIGGWKLALWVTLVGIIALALVLTFASLFVIAAVVSAAIAAVALLLAWIRGLFK